MEERRIAIDEGFWAEYDLFCQPSHIEKFITCGHTQIAEFMRGRMRSLHVERRIHSLTRPERKWEHHKAWLSLRNEPIFNDHGSLVLHMRVGDVVAVEFGWDRDVIVTHSPVTEHVSGYLLSGHWDSMVGLFMPLFDASTILECVKHRMAMNVAESLARAKEQQTSWGWY